MEPAFGRSLKLVWLTFKPIPEIIFNSFTDLCVSTKIPQTFFSPMMISFGHLTKTWSEKPFKYSATELQSHWLKKTKSEYDNSLTINTLTAIFLPDSEIHSFPE